MIENYIKQLQGKNIKLWINNDYFGIYSYDSNKKRYQGEFGYITIEAVIKHLKGDIAYNHLKIEFIDGDN